jgi:hypothetical protein
MFNIVNSFFWNPIWVLLMHLATLAGAKDENPTDIDKMPSGLTFAA